MAGHVELEQLDQIKTWAKAYGVLVHHCGDSRHCLGDPGMLDLVLVGPRGVLWVELKSSNAKLTEGQTSWRWMLKAAGAQVEVWLPSHLRDGHAQAAIQSIGQRSPMIAAASPKEMTS